MGEKAQGRGRMSTNALTGSLSFSLSHTLLFLGALPGDSCSPCLVNSDLITPARGGHSGS